MDKCSAGTLRARLRHFAFKTIHAKAHASNAAMGSHALGRKPHLNSVGFTLRSHHAYGGAAKTTHRSSIAVIVTVVIAFESVMCCSPLRFQATSSFMTAPRGWPRCRRALEEDRGRDNLLLRAEGARPSLSVSYWPSSRPLLSGSPAPFPLPSLFIDCVQLSSWEHKQSTQLNQHNR